MGVKKHKTEQAAATATAKADGSQASAAAGKKATAETPAKSEKSDFLKLFWTLAESERDTRMAAAAKLLTHLRQSTRQDTEVEYTLKRLVRGLASSRDAARQGFSAALAGLLAAFPTQLALSDARELLRDSMEVSSSMKPMEQREHMFGRLFGLLALHRSGRLAADEALLAAVIRELLEMANFKRWFREACYEAALALLADVPAELFLSELAAPIHKTLQPRGAAEDAADVDVSAWNADQVLLAAGVQRYLSAVGIAQDDAQLERLPQGFAAVNVVARNHLRQLAKPLRSSSGCYPHVHSAWLSVMGHVLRPLGDAELDSELVAEAWTALVENSLVGGAPTAGDGTAAAAGPTSHERQGLALKLFELVAPQLPTTQLQVLLTPRFVKCLYCNAVAKKNYLHAAARHCLQAFARCAPREFFDFFRAQFASPVALLVSEDDADESDEEDEPKSKKAKTSAGGFDALLQLEEKRERAERLTRRTDRARLWALETLVTALTEQLSAREKGADRALQDEMLRFLAFHALFVAKAGGKKDKKSKKSKKAAQKTPVELLAQEAASATPAVTETVANYAKTRLLSLLSVGLAGADGCRASASVLSRIFAVTQELQASEAAVALREPLDEAAEAQLAVLVAHVETLGAQEVESSTEPQETDKKTKKAVARRPLGEAFLLLFMSAGLQLLDGEQRSDAVVVAADLDKCYAQLVARTAGKKSSKKKSSKKKSKKAGKEAEADADEQQQSVVVLTDLLLSLLAQDSSALREIVTQAFRSLLPLLDAACLATLVGVLQPAESADAAAEDEDEDEFAPVTRREDAEEDAEEEEEEEEEEEVALTSAAEVSEALRGDEKLAALHREDLALAAIVGQVKHRAQRKKDAKRARLQTLHFQLRVLDLLQVFVAQRTQEEAATEAETQRHAELVLGLVSPLLTALARVQKADAEKRVLSERLQAVLLRQVLRAKDKELPTSASARVSAVAALRQVLELVRVTALEKEQAGKAAAAAVVFLLRVLGDSEDAASDAETQELAQTAVLDAFAKKHSRFPRAAFDELLSKFPAVGARVLLSPLATVAAAADKEEHAAVDDFSKCEVFRLLTLLLRAGAKLGAEELSSFAAVRTKLRTALVQQLAPEAQQQLKPKRMKLVLAFALQLVKFWRATAMETTEKDVQAVAAAVLAVESSSPVVTSMAKQVATAAGVEVPSKAASAKKPKASKKPTTSKKQENPAEDDDELMPEAEATAKPKSKTQKKSKAKDKKRKRKQSVSED